MVDPDGLNNLAQKLKAGHMPMGAEARLILTYPDPLLPLLFEKFETPNGFQFAAMMAHELHGQPEQAVAPARERIRCHAIGLCAGDNPSLVSIGMQLLSAFQEDPAAGQVLRGKVADPDPRLRVTALREYRMWTLTGPKSDEELQYLLGVVRDPLLALAQIAAEIVRDKYEDPGPLKDVVRKRDRPFGGVDAAIDVLRGGNVFEMSKAFTELESRGQSVIPAMLNLMEEATSKELKGEIRNSISRMGGGGNTPRKEVVDALLRGVASGDPITRGHSANLLSLYTGDSRVRDRIASLAESAGPPGIRLTAINDLSAKWAARHIPLLRKLLGERDPAVQVYSAVVLARHGNDAGYAVAANAVRETIRAIEGGVQPNVSLMRMALQTLGHVGGPADIPLIEAFLAFGTKFNSLAGREAIWEIELRTATAEGRELKYLQHRYGAGATEWSLIQLGTRANERQRAEVLFAVMTSAEATERARKEAVSSLLAAGWLEPRVVGLEASAYKLRERPPANPAGVVLGFVVRAIAAGLQWRRR